MESPRQIVRAYVGLVYVRLLFIVRHGMLSCMDQVETVDKTSVWSLTAAGETDFVDVDETIVAFRTLPFDLDWRRLYMAGDPLDHQTSI